MPIRELLLRGLFRDKVGYTFTLISFILCSALITQSNLILSFSSAEAVSDARSDILVDMTVNLISPDGINGSQTEALTEQVKSIQGIESCERFAIFHGVVYERENPSIRHNTTIAAIDSDTHYFESVRPSEWNEDHASNAAVVSDDGNFTNYEGINPLIDANISLYKDGYLQQVHLPLDEIRTRELTSSQKNISRGILSSAHDASVSIYGNVVIMDYRWIMESIEDTLSLEFLQGYSNWLLSTIGEDVINPFQIESSIFHLTQITTSTKNVVQSVSPSSVVTNNLGVLMKDILSWSNKQNSQAQESLINILFVSAYLVYVSYGITWKHRKVNLGKLRIRGFSGTDVNLLAVTESIVNGILGGVVGFVVGVVGFLLYLFLQTKSAILLVFHVSIFPMQVLYVLGLTTLLSVGCSGFLMLAGRNGQLTDQIKDSDSEEDYHSSEESVVPFRYVVALTLLAIIQVLWDLLDGNVIYQMVISSLSNALIIIILDFLRNVIRWISPISPIILAYAIAMYITRYLELPQKIADKGGRVINGDLGSVFASRSMRDMEHSISLLFILCFIVAFSTMNPILASSQLNHDTRSIQARIGSDMTITLSSSDYLNATRSALEANENTPVYSEVYVAQMYLVNQRLSVATIDVDSWLDSAYYEAGWFSGSSGHDIIASLNGNQCIAEQSFVERIGLGVGDSLSLSLQPFSVSLVNLTVSGLMDYMPHYDATGITEGILVPMDFVEILERTQYEVRILTRLSDEANIEEIRQQILAIDSSASVEIASEKIVSLLSGPEYRGPNAVNTITTSFGFAVTISGLALICTAYSLRMEQDLISLMRRGISHHSRTLILLSGFVTHILLAFTIGIPLGLLLSYSSIKQMSASSTQGVPYRFIIDISSSVVLVVELLIVVVTVYSIFYMFNRNANLAKRRKVY